MFVGYIYPFLCLIVPTIFIEFFGAVYYWRESKGNFNKTIMQKHIIQVFILMIYVFGVIKVTGFGALADVKNCRGLENFHKINMDFSVFRNFSWDTWRTDFYLNVLLFVPFGFLLPYIWPEYKRLARTLIMGFVFSLMIESAQYFNWRLSDVDDLICNVVGTFVGYMIWLGISPALKKNNYKNVGLFAGEVAICIILGLLSIFFLYNRWIRGYRI